jgi:catechol 2,3-dioxygenase-like lactoylglutathione lyase family enzyme
MAVNPNISIAAESVVPDGFKISPMNRATIFVRDQEKSLKLYRDLLGLHVWFNNYWDNDGINAIMNTHGATLRAVALESGDSVFGKLGIYQLGPAEKAKAPSPEQGTVTKTGDFAIVFTTNDIDALTAKIKAAGYPIVSPPVVLKENPDNAVQGREMMFRDPDGVLVNLVQPGVPKKK